MQNWRLQSLQLCGLVNGIILLDDLHAHLQKFAGLDEVEDKDDNDALVLVAVV
jgi:hypothetical protein